MANDENLIPMNRRTKSEQRKIATAGGKASGAARRKKRDMRKAAEMLLNMPVSNKQSTMKATLTALGIDEEDMDYSMGVMAAGCEWKCKCCKVPKRYRRAEPNATATRKRICIPEETGQRGKESRRGWRHDRWNASRNISARKGGRGR